MMKRYKIGVIGASSILGKNILKILIEKNFPYSFIRAISYSNEQKEIKIDDYQFSLTNLSIDSIKDLDIVFIVLENHNIDEYFTFIKENNKYAIIIENLLNHININSINIENISKDDNILKCPLVNSLVVKKIFENIEIETLEMSCFHSSIEHGDEGIYEMNQQYIDYFNYKPLIARVFPNVNAHHIPLAFNMIPFTNNSYEVRFKDEVYRLINKISNIVTVDFYIPSFYSSAIQFKVLTNQTNELLDNLKHNNDIRIFDNNCPTLLDGEGTSIIQIGNLKNNSNEISFFATFDVIKLVSNNALKMIEKRITYDNI